MPGIPSPNLLAPAKPAQTGPTLPLGGGAAAPPPQDYGRAFSDTVAARAAIYDTALAALQETPETSNATHTLRLRDVRYVDPESYSVADQKKALLTGTSLGRRMRGTWDLVDNATQKTLDSREQVLGAVPYLTDRGTFIHNGSENAIRNQQRLRAGVFTRRRDNGQIEAHANVLSGGPSHRYELDPEKGRFLVRIGNSKLPLLPLLRSQGVTDAELQKAWGKDIWAANAQDDDPSAMAKYVKKVLRDKVPEGKTPQKALAEAFAGMKLDPVVTSRTLGNPREGLDKDALLDVTRKLLAVSKGEAEPDDRDALVYQKFLGPEDLFGERLRKDYGRTRQSLLWKMTGEGSLKKMPSSALRDQIESAITKSGLGQSLEQINPSEMLDKLYATTRMGEGGIPSADSIPDEARNVQPSHLGYIDPIRTPESNRVGIDLYMAHSTRKGKDGTIYSRFTDPKGQETWKTPQEAADMAVSFPGSMRMKGKRVPAIQNGKIRWVDKNKVDLVVPAMDDAFSPLGNMIPMKSMVKGQRVSMASRMTTQATALREPESPLVRGMFPGREDWSFEQEYGKQLGAMRADKPGQVVSVEPGKMTVRYQDGTTEEKELYDNFPFNRKSTISQTPVLQPGDTFTPGQTLARSNYTDESGAAALGRNARTAYMSWEGANFEDAVVISQSYADKMESEHLYQQGLDLDDRMKTGKKEFIGLFPSRWDKKKLETLDKNGVVKPGTVVHHGDPLVLAARRADTAANKVHRKGEKPFSDASLTWDHHDEGVVTDVVEGKNGPVVAVKAFSKMRVGDKLSGRYGDKGVIAKIVPDHQLPELPGGEKPEVLLNPLGIVSRTNPAQLAELALGKIAAKTGQPISVKDFDDEKDMVEWVLGELDKHGLNDIDDLVDPNTDRKIKGIANGSRFFMKLHHMAESKGQVRGTGAYTQDGQPAKGGGDGAKSKRLALLDTNALMAHGAVATLQDTAVRGQANEEHQLRFMQGHDPPKVKIPQVYEKFVAQLQAAGVNVRRNGSATNIMAMTNADVDELAGKNEITDSATVDWKDRLKPVRGGLFDPKVTGGHGSKKWAAIPLAEPMPNPAMEEPIRRILGLTGKQFESVLAGREDLGKHGKGPGAIAKALDAIDIDRELAMTRDTVRNGRKGERDKAVRRLGYLKSAKKLDLHPRDWVLKRAPVLPTAFRPVSMMGGKMPLVADPNYLYKDLIDANNSLKEMRDQVGEDDIGDERLATYQAFKAVTGLGDPITQKTRDKGVKGLLKDVFGSSPKYGTVQRKLLSTTVDNVGRAVITPNPGFDMDTVGIPQDKAYDLYKKFVARRLKRGGMPLQQALREIDERSDAAKHALQEEMEHRPVFINRAPVLHKHGVLAFRPKLVAGDAMQVSPLIVKGFGADFDGDAMNYHVPSGEDARKEALERLLPSKNLLSQADFRSPVHAPSQEYIGGLYEATSPDRKSKRPKKIFRTVADLRKAMASGQVDKQDEVEILEA